MGIQALRVDLQFQKRCDKCKKPRKHLYKVNLDGYTLFVCSAHCAEQSRSNWQEKKDKNIAPGTPLTEETDTPEMLGDNTELE